MTIAEWTSRNSYALLDSGGGEKLEQVGEYRIIRPCPRSPWKRALPAHEWEKADATYHRDEMRGRWEKRREIPTAFPVRVGAFTVTTKLTSFGHLGIFPEQDAQWIWMQDVIKKRAASGSDPTHILNLFAYTGGSTLAASSAGAHVVHVDASRGTVQWARENAALNNMEKHPIRWIVDDATKFLKREKRRGNTYHGIILDPPSFGRGPKGEVFKLEDHLPSLLEDCRNVVAPDALFILLTCHTPGLASLALNNSLQDVVREYNGEIEHGEMTIPESSGRALPAGFFARWKAKEL